MSEEEFAVVCSGPLEVAYGAMDSTLLRMYFSFLREYDAGLLAAAVAQLIATSKWLPKIAEIRMAAGIIACGELVEMSASEAWGLAQKAYRRIDFEIPDTLAKARDSVPPIVWEAMQNAGLSSLVYGKGDWPQKHFHDAYNALVAKERALRMAPPHVLKEISERRQAMRLPPSREAMAVAKAIGSEI